MFMLQHKYLIRTELSENIVRYQNHCKCSGYRSTILCACCGESNKVTGRCCLWKTESFCNCQTWKGEFQSWYTR